MENDSIDLSEKANKDGEISRFVGQSDILHSVMLVCKLSPFLKNRQMVLDYFDILISKCKAIEPITGVLLVYPYHLVTIIETNLKSLLFLFQTLNENEEQYSKLVLLNRSNESDNGDIISNKDDQISFDKRMANIFANTIGPIIKSRILFINHNIGFRLFRSFENKILDMEPANLDLYESNESDEKRLIDLIAQLNKLIAYLVLEPMRGLEEYVPEIFRINIDRILQNLRTDVPNLVPQQVVIGYFAERSEYEGLISVKEYLDYYFLPYDVVLQSEDTWPIAKNSFFYN